MIVCKKCGNQNPDDATFCASCRAFLEWSGEKVVEPPPPPPPPPPAVEPETNFVDRVKQAVGLDQPRPEPAGGPAAAAAATPPPVPGPVAAAQSSAPTVEATAVAAAPEVRPAEVAVAPRTPDVPVARIPQAVVPAPERARQAPKIDTATGQKYRPGDVICGQCGAGNNPERHFCQRCGATLASAVVVKTPWYRKLLGPRAAPAAGTRPKGAPVERAWGAALFRVVALGVVALFVLVYLAVPPVRERVNSTVSAAYAAAHRHFAPSLSHVEPSGATGSSQLSTHPARLSVDLIKETYWAANMATDKQPWLRLSFGGPVDFDQMLFTSGAANNYASMARPKDVQIVMSDKSSVRLTLKDSPDPQTYDLTGRHVTFVEIHILSVYPTAQSTDVAINEVEFVRIQ